MSKSMLSEKSSRDFFSRQFVSVMDLWKQKTGGKQYDFAKRIFVSPNMIGEYKKGVFPSDETLRLMVKIFQEDGLDITEEYFYPSTHDEKYKDSKAFVEDTVIKGRIDFAEEIGVSLDFLRFIWDRVDTSKYPVWSPIILMQTGGFHVKEYRRQPLGTTNVSTDFLQVKTPEGKHLLGDIDIRILKDIQRQVECFIEYLFHQRRKDMEDQVEEANRQYGKPIESSDGWAFAFGDSLTKEELESIDKYMQYVIWRDKHGEH